MDNYKIVKIDPAMTKKIRKYFEKGHSTASAICMIIIGGIFAFSGLMSYYRFGTYLMLLGLLLAFTGVNWLLENIFTGEEEADKAKAQIVKSLQKRGMEKLNIVKEQINLVSPVLLIGPGAKPNASFAEAKKNAVIRTGVIKIFILWVKILIRKAQKEYDPEEKSVIGSDEHVRSLLIEVSLYFMTETQVLRYVGDVDISTGMIYQESTSECFYQDIEAIKFKQSIYKVFHIRKKKYVNIMNESFVLYMSGSSFWSSIDSRYKNKLWGDRFMAMRNLIRDKKNENVQ